MNNTYLSEAILRRIESNQKVDILLNKTHNLHTHQHLPDTNLSVPVWQKDIFEQQLTLTPRQLQLQHIQEQQQLEQTAAPPKVVRSHTNQNNSTANTIETNTIEYKQQQLLILLGKLIQHKQKTDYLASPISPRSINKAKQKVLEATKRKLIDQYITQGEHHRNENRHLHALQSFQHAILIKQQLPTTTTTTGTSPTRPVVPRSHHNQHQISPRQQHHSTNMHHSYHPPSRPTSRIATSQRMSPWTPNYPQWGRSIGASTSTSENEWKLITDNAHILSSTKSNFFGTTKSQDLDVQTQHRENQAKLYEQGCRRKRRLKKTKKLELENDSIFLDVPKNKNSILNFGYLPAYTNYRHKLTSRGRFHKLRERKKRPDYEREESLLLHGEERELETRSRKERVQVSREETTFELKTRYRNRTRNRNRDRTESTYIQDDVIVQGDVSDEVTSIHEWSTGNL